jgi:hypothetical protein
MIKMPPLSLNPQSSLILLVLMSLFSVSSSQALENIKYSENAEYRKLQQEWLGRPADELIVGGHTFKFLNREMRNSYTKALMQVLAEIEMKPQRDLCVRAGQVIPTYLGGGCRPLRESCAVGEVACDQVFEGTKGAKGTICVLESLSQNMTRTCIDKTKSWTGVSNRLASSLSFVSWFKYARAINKYCGNAGRLNASSLSAQNQSQSQSAFRPGACEDLSRLVTRIRVPGRILEQSDPEPFFKEEAFSFNTIQVFGAWPILMSYLYPQMISKAEAQAAAAGSAASTAIDAVASTCKANKLGNGVEKTDGKAGEPTTGYSFVGSSGGRSTLNWDNGSLRSSSGKPSDLDKAVASGDCAKIKKESSGSSGDAEKDKKKTDEEHKALQAEIKKDGESKVGYFSQKITREEAQAHRGINGFLASYLDMRTVLGMCEQNQKANDLTLAKLYGKKIVSFMQKVITERQQKNNDKPNDSKLSTMEAGKERTDGFRHVEERDNICEGIITLAQSEKISPAEAHQLLATQNKILTSEKPEEELKKFQDSIANGSATGNIKSAGLRDMIRRLAMNTAKMVERQDVNKAAAAKGINEANLKYEKESTLVIDDPSSPKGGGVTQAGGGGEKPLLDALVAECQKAPKAGASGAAAPSGPSSYAPGALR